MTVDRRRFLTLLLAGAATTGAAALLANEAIQRGAAQPTAGTATSAPTAVGPTPGAVTQAATAPSTAIPPTAALTSTATLTPKPTATPGARTMAWLRMLALEHTPHSGADYEAHLDQIDVAIPLNGGKLLGDGTWLQEPDKVSAEWPRRVKALAKGAGHLYMPAVGNDRDGTVTALLDPVVQEKAARDLVALATTGRHDSPWDGIYIDIEAIEYEYRPQMSDFLRLVHRYAKDAGLLLGISLSGIFTGPGYDPEKTDAYDFALVGELADMIDLRCYDYFSPPPRSIGPHWWAEASIRFALDKGIAPEKMALGVANYSRYWPNSESGLSQEMTHGQAMALVAQNGAQVEWVEQNEHGPVREKYAKIGAGHIWIHDSETYRAGLELVSKYGLAGKAIFAPGMGDPADWDVVKAWREARA